MTISRKISSILQNQTLCSYLELLSPFSSFSTVGKIPMQVLFSKTTLVIGPLAAATADTASLTFLR